MNVPENNPPSPERCANGDPCEETFSSQCDHAIDLAGCVWRSIDILRSGNPSGARSRKMRVALFQSQTNWARASGVRCREWKLAAWRTYVMKRESRCILVCAAYAIRQLLWLAEWL